MMQILKIGKIRKCLLAKLSTFRNDNWINSWISLWVNAIYLTESLHYMGLSLSWLPGPDCHFFKSNLMVSTRAEICHSRAFKFPGKFPGKLEKSGKIPVSRESKNPGKSTPLIAMRPHAAAMQYLCPLLVVSIFPDFGLPGKWEISQNFQAFPGISWEICEHYNFSF